MIICLFHWDLLVHMVSIDSEIDVHTCSQDESDKSESVCRKSKSNCVCVNEATGFITITLDICTLQQ